MQNLTKLPRRIALLGMMGCGKSSIGKRLAKTLNLPFSDTDKQIEKQVGATISDIFAQFGEAYFRTRERNIIAEAIAAPEFVIALGGGAYLQEEVHTALKKTAKTIYLRVPCKILWDRVCQNANRPLAQAGYAEFEALLEARRHIYETADIIIDCDKDTSSTILNNIIATLQTA